MAIEPPQILGLTDWRPLARGGFALVWEARQKTLDRLVAVKVDQRPLDDEVEQRRFLREAGAAGKMSAHPGIVTVHDAGILPDNRPYLVMDLCPGGSLTRYLEAESRPGQEEVRDIGVRIADALTATHARGVLHRDVKPANILIDGFGHVGLADFGLAALPGPRTPPEEAFEALTPAYTAPEILRRQPPRETGDVYSLAATMYALLAGRPPRWPESGTPTLTEVVQLQQQPVEPLTDVEPGLMQVLMDALALDPAARPSAAEFGARLADLPLASPAGGAVALPADPPRRRWGLLVGVAALVLVAALITALVLGRGSDPVVAVPPASPTAGTSSASPTPSDSPTAVLPPGFVDCSDALGGPGSCRPEPECWGGLFSGLDSPAVIPAADCFTSHNYQTFAAGPLDFDVRRQSQLDRDPDVTRVCSAKVLRRMLSESDRNVAQQIRVVPPQESDGVERFYRCIFGGPDTVSPVRLKPLG